MKEIVPATLLFIVLIFINTACNNAGKKHETADTIQNNVTTENTLVFDKLVGLWQQENGKSFERWSKNENGSYRSVAFSVKGTDTSWNEQASIYPEGGDWIFENNVAGQNEGKSVKFTSLILEANSVQFNNPAHDFPTDVNYTVIDSKTMHAFIVGPNTKGGKDTIPFSYTRLN